MLNEYLYFTINFVNEHNFNQYIIQILMSILLFWFMIKNLIIIAKCVSKNKMLKNESIDKEFFIPVQ